MSTSTQTETIQRPRPAHTVEYELRELRLRSDVPEVEAPPAEQEAKAPYLKLFGAGFSFFCAGVNDGTLGPLVPYILATFSLKTGDIAIM